MVLMLHYFEVLDLTWNLSSAIEKNCVIVKLILTVDAGLKVL